MFDIVIEAEQVLLKYASSRTILSTEYGADAIELLEHNFFHVPDIPIELQILRLAVFAEKREVRMRNEYRELALGHQAHSIVSDITKKGIYDKELIFLRRTVEREKVQFHKKIRTLNAIESLLEHELFTYVNESGVFRFGTDGKTYFQRDIDMMPAQDQDTYYDESI